MFPPFPHGVMAAHGSLEPFVLVRVQVGELARIKAPAESVCRSFYPIRKRSSRKLSGTPRRNIRNTKNLRGALPHMGGHLANAPIHTYVRRTGNPGRGVPGKCQTVQPRSRLRTQRGWRWPEAARLIARSNRPNASLQESARCR